LAENQHDDSNGDLPEFEAFNFKANTIYLDVLKISVRYRIYPSCGSKQVCYDDKLTIQLA
jgi:hypothetical protein